MTSIIRHQTKRNQTTKLALNQWIQLTKQKMQYFGYHLFFVIARFRHRQKLWVKDRSDAISLLFRASEFENQDQAHEYMSHIWPSYFFEAKPSYIRKEHQPLYTVRTLYIFHV